MLIDLDIYSGLAERKIFKIKLNEEINRPETLNEQLHQLSEMKKNSRVRSSKLFLGEKRFSLFFSTDPVVIAFDTREELKSTLSHCMGSLIQTAGPEIRICNIMMGSNDRCKCGMPHNGGDYYF